jgi:hypothetical protein
MKINNVNFNEDWARSVDEPAFVKHFLPVVWQDIPEQERADKLSAAYKLLTGELQPEANKQQEAPTQTKRVAKKSKPETQNEGAE